MLRLTELCRSKAAWISASSFRPLKSQSRREPLSPSDFRASGWGGWNSGCIKKWYYSWKTTKNVKNSWCCRISHLRWREIVLCGFDNLEPCTFVQFDFILHTSALHSPFFDLQFWQINTAVFFYTQVTQGHPQMWIRWTWFTSRSTIFRWHQFPVTWATGVHLMRCFILTITWLKWKVGFLNFRQQYFFKHITNFVKGHVNPKVQISVVRSKKLQSEKTNFAFVWPNSNPGWSWAYFIEGKFGASY